MLEGDDLLPDETHDLTVTTEEIQSPVEERPVIQPQPAVISTRINDRDVVRTTDIRVSERTPLSDLRLKPFDPIYNELTGEVHTCIYTLYDCMFNIQCFSQHTQCVSALLDFNTV